MTEQEKRQHRCCFTGHLPEKLNMPETEVIAWLDAEIRKAIDVGFVTFVSVQIRSKCVQNLLCYKSKTARKGGADNG